MSLVLGGIAGISLLVGGIGIMNIMLVTVSEGILGVSVLRLVDADDGKGISGDGHLLSYRVGIAK